MNKNKYYVITFLTFFLSLNVFSQNINVKGIITDENGESLPGVTVLQEGTNNGTISGSNGDYSITVPSTSTLVFSYIGMLQVTENVGARTEINVTMKPSIVGLEEVVAIGYGTVKKSDLTGSVSSLKFDDVKESSITSFEQGMQGKLAGVLVSQGDNAPGGGLSIQIRGNGSLLGGGEPLYVIDGFPIQGGNVLPEGEKTGPANQIEELTPASNLLNFVNPDDIESIQILKDASATAIYGSRGANGVVLITTKKGNSGKAKITFSHSSSISHLEKKVNLLDAAEYAEYRNKQVINSNYIKGVAYEDIISDIGLPFDGITNPTPEEYRNGTAKSTDWQDEIYRTSYSSKYSLNVQGGNEKIKYFLGTSFLDQKGIIIGSNLKKYTLNSNISANLSSKLSINNSLIAAGIATERSQTSTASFGDKQGVVASALRYPPSSLIGEVFEDIENGGQGSDDPYTLATEFIDERTDYDILESINLNYEVLNGLEIDIRGGVRYANKMRDMYYPLTTFRGLNQNGRASSSFINSLNLINENLIRYNKVINDHSINLVAGFTQEKNQTRNQYTYVRGFTNDLLTYHSMQSGSETYPPTTSFIDYSLKSYLGRINYNYKNKYLITASLRADGSSKFGANNKWGYFPSGAFAWRISDEGFLKDVKNLSSLKLRVSYGETGNQGIRPYQSLAALGPVRYTLDGENISLGYQNSLIENPDLKWETTKQSNVGFDLSLFENRISLTTNFYRKNTTDLLQNVTLPGSSGYAVQLQNRGSLINIGFELELRTIVLDNNVKWDLSFNYSKNTNEIRDLGDVTEIPGNWVILWEWFPFKLKEGMPLGTIFGYETDGIFQTQEEVDNSATLANKAIGEFKIKNQNDDDVIDIKDEVVLGDTNPDFTFGFTNNFAYKNFDLSIFLMGNIGQDILNLNSRVNTKLADGVNQRKNAYENSWQPEVKDADGNIIYEANTDAEWHMVGSNARSYNLVIDKFVENASFVRIKNIRLGYTFKPNKYLENVRLFASVNNLLTFTDYSGYDPEASIYGQDPTRRGVDFGAYPSQRTYEFGMNITF